MGIVKRATLLALLSAAAGTAGCEDRRSPRIDREVNDEAGEVRRELDDAADDVGDAAENAGEDLEEGINDGRR